MKCLRRFTSPPKIFVSQSMDTAWRKEMGKFVNISKLVFQKCTQGMQPWEVILFFPIWTTYNHLEKRVGRRRSTLSIHPAHSSSFSGHGEAKFWSISNWICLGKGHSSRGQWEHHPTAASTSLARVMRDIKLSEKLSAETFQRQTFV